MTISSDVSRSGPYIGNGATTVFSRTFKIIDSDHLKVYETISGVTSEVTTGIVLDGIGADSGDVTFDVAPEVGTLITLIREVPLLQETDYSAQGRVSPVQIEDDLDLQEMQIQDLSEKQDRSLRYPVTTEGVSSDFPAPVSGQTVIGNSAGDGYELGPSADAISGAQGYAEAAETARDEALDAVADFRDFKDLSTLIADTTHDYVDTTAGDVWRTRAEGFPFIVAASDATDHHRVTAGGVKLYAHANATGYVYGLQFGIVYGDRSEASSNAERIVTAAEYAADSGFTGLNLGFGVIHTTPVKIELSAPIHLTGAGIGEWTKQQPYGGGGGTNRTVAPTQLVIHNAARDLQVLGISSMQSCGAMWANPSARSGYNDDNYKMLSFMNDDQTIRSFSAGLYIKGGGCTDMHIDNFRVLLDGGGDDGMDFYDDSDALVTDDWAQGDIDIGVYINGAGSVVFSDFQSVGHWRMAGEFISATKTDVDGYLYGADGTYEIRHNRCIYEGFVACSNRASDSFPILAITTSTVEVPWADDHPFVTSGDGGFGNVFLGGNYLSGEAVGFTSAVLVNVSGEDRVRITLDEDPIALGYAVGSVCHPRHTGGGSSGVQYTECVFRPLVHPTGYMAHNTTLTHAFPNPSTIREIGGWKMVEIQFQNCIIEGYGEVDFHIHNMWKMLDTGSQYEINPERDGTGDILYRNIAAPWIDDNPNVAAGRAAGFSREINITNSINVRHDNNHDYRPYYANTHDGWFTDGADNGMWMPISSNVSEKSFFIDRDKRGLAAPIDGRVGFTKSGYTYADTSSTPLLRFWYDDDDDIISLNVDILPNTNSISLGSNTQYWQSINGITWNVPSGESGKMDVNGATHFLWNGGVFRPQGDDEKALGNASNRWEEVHAAAAAINTSDKREKTDIRDLSDAERAVALKIKENLRAFRWKKAVAEKGDDARIHFGVMAQEVVELFASEGLDAFAYGMVCYDEWEAEFDKEGNQTLEAGNRYGVRYSELLAFVLAAI